MPAQKRAFRGNEKIKNCGVTTDWTPKLIKEYVKCRDDVFYFIEKYFMIITERGLEHMVLRDYQREMITAMRDGRYTLAVMSRQAGKTECFRAFILWYILFNDYKTVAILANVEKAAMEILNKLQISYQSLPLWLQHGVKDFNKGNFVLENESRVFANSTSKDSLRGWTVHLIIIDEAAHIDAWEDFYTAVEPTISAGKETKMVMASTPNGLNHFYNMFEGSKIKIDKEGKSVPTNGFHSIFVPWYKVPGRDEHWKDEALKRLNFDMVKFSQEYECSFIGSSNTLIMGWKLELLKASIREPLAELDHLLIYEQPIKNAQLIDYGSPVSPHHKYVLVADVSRGKGLDYSAFNVFDVTSIPYRQVASYRCNEITPTDYSAIIYKAAQFYNDAVVLTEINDIGEQVGTLLLEEYCYEHVLCSEGSGRGGKKLCYNHQKADKGIRTTTPLKMSGCLLLKLLLEQNKLELCDEGTINELLVFVKSKNSYKADTGYHDDLAMTLVIFSWLSDQEYFRENYELNTMMSMAEISQAKLEEGMLPFGYSQARPNDLLQEFNRITNLNIPFSPFRQYEPWENDTSKEPHELLYDSEESLSFFFDKNRVQEALPTIVYDRRDR